MLTQTSCSAKWVQTSGAMTEHLYGVLVGENHISANIRAWVEVLPMGACPFFFLMVKVNIWEVELAGSGSVLSGNFCLQLPHDSP